MPEPAHPEDHPIHAYLAALKSAAEEYALAVHAYGNDPNMIGRLTAEHLGFLAGMLQVIGTTREEWLKGAAIIWDRVAADPDVLQAVLAREMRCKSGMS